MTVVSSATVRGAARPPTRVVVCVEAVLVAYAKGENEEPDVGTADWRWESVPRNAAGKSNDRYLRRRGDMREAV